jgi:hypothetical protein
MADIRNSKLFESQQSRLDSSAFFDRYYNHVLDFNSPRIKEKKKMAVITLKVLWWIGEGFTLGFTVFSAINFGLTDIKTLVGLLFICIFGVLKALSMREDLRKKRLTNRKEEYEFQQKIKHDQQLLNP